MRLVSVEWVDSHGGGGWASLKEARYGAEEETLRCETVGWLIAETDRYIALATSRGLDKAGAVSEVCDVMQIPCCAITAVRSLSAGRKRAHR